MPKVPSVAGSKLVRDFVERLLVANKSLRYVDAPLVPRPTKTSTALKPDVVYTAGKGAKNRQGKKIRYVYTTDSKGRLASAHARPLELPPMNQRGPHNPSTPGKMPGDHAGHLIADMFGGSGKLDNLVSQLSQVNLSEIKRIEEGWLRRLNKTPPDVFDVDVKVIYGTGGRPTGFRLSETLADGSIFRHVLIRN